jgi:uncharacterized protein (DUF362 family)
MPELTASTQPASVQALARVVSLKTTVSVFDSGGRDAISRLHRRVGIVDGERLRVRTFR